MEHPENNESYKGLVVNAGIEQPSSVNPYRRLKPKKRQLFRSRVCGRYHKRGCNHSEPGGDFGGKCEA